MSKILGILKYLLGYKRYALLNIVCNIIYVVFSLFSLVMLAPVLNILFLSNDKDYATAVAKGLPEISYSPKGLLDFLNYYFSNYILAHGKTQALVMICTTVVAIFFFKNLFRYMAMYAVAPIRNGVVKDIRNAIFKKTLDLPLAYYSEERKGDIMSRITSDVQEIEWSIMQSLEMIFRDPINIILFLVTLIQLSPQLALFLFLMLPLSILAIVYVGKSLKQTSFNSRERLGVLFSIMEETLSGLRIIKGFNAEKIVYDKFSETNRNYTQIMIKIYRRVDLSSPLSEFLGIISMVVVIYFGGKLVLDPNETLKAAEFITFIAIFSQIIPPVKSLTTAYYNVKKGIASVDRINKILDAEVSIDEAPNAQPLTTFKHQIEYRDVSFAYHKTGEGWVLKDLNLIVPKGKSIALVGQSGSGKTTMADLLPRFYDIDKGTIFIDGIPIKDIKIKDLRNLMGIVSQESILFNDSVYNNIAFGMSNITEADVIHSAKIANAHDFIMQMPEGYQTNIGDRGGKLSGGQRQRMSIARAILKNPPILILDEATSALDTESERLVQDALNKLMQNRTSIIIAHRLSTIQHADEIIVLQKGQITERGNHTQLLAREGIYKKLYDLQLFV